MLCQDRLVGKDPVGGRKAVHGETSDWAPANHGTGEISRDKADGRVGDHPYRACANFELAEDFGARASR